MRRWWARCAELFRRGRRERDLQDELAAHVELHAAELERSGLAPPEARRRACLALGGVEQTRERCRDRLGWPALDHAARDLRFALRSLRKAPGVTAVIVLTLALGVGANCAAFTLAWSAIFRPLPFPQAGRLVWISSTDVRQHRPGQPAVSPDQLRAWRPDLQRMFSGYAWVSRGGAGDTYRVRGVAMQPVERSASGNLFALLGVRPALGRLLGPADAAPRQSHAVVLSNAFWRRAYGADPRAVGQTIQSPYSATPYTIVGVLPASFRLDQSTDLWFPTGSYPQRRSYALFELIGRRRPRLSIAAVQQRIVALEARNPLETRGILHTPVLTFQVEALHDHLASGWRQPLLLLLGAAACLLLLACLNIANLLLARARERQAELALRLTLGCPRWRLARQLLFESGLLALAGSLAGWGAAAAGLRLLQGAATALLPAALAASLSHLNLHGAGLAILAFALLLALLVLLVAGLAPALRAASWNLRGRIQARGRLGRAPQLLVAAQAALALTLVLGATLLLHSFVTLAHTDPGFQARGRYTFDVRLPLPQCAGKPCAWTADGAIPAYLTGVLQRIRALPGVTAAAGVNGVPLSDTNPDDFGPVPARYQNVFPLAVTSGYFATMGIPLLRGRDFNAGDRPGIAKKLIVNQAFADRYFPGEPVVGRTIPLVRCQKGLFGDPQDGCLVIGVVGNVRDESLALAPQPATYMDIAQDPPLGYGFVVRSTRPPSSLLEELRHLLRSLPPLPGGGEPYVSSAHPLAATVAASIATPRFRGWLAGLFAALALALAAVGVYGVQSHAVSRRRHEIAVRMALGASNPRLRRWILADALRWMLLGVAVGLPLALAAARALAHWLYAVPLWDPVATMGAPLLLAAVAVLAAWRPARRATAVDPNRALRAE